MKKLLLALISLNLATLLGTQTETTEAGIETTKTRAVSCKDQAATTVTETNTKTSDSKAQAKPTNAEETKTANSEAQTEKDKPNRINWCPDCENWYAAVTGAFSWHNDSTLGDRSNVEYNPGGSGSISIGYMVESWRLEIEAIYFYFKSKKFNDPTGTSFVDGGYLSHLGGFANLFYNLPLGKCFSFYFGGGVGIVQTSIKVSAGAGGSTDDDYTNLGWQLIAGFEYNITCRWSWTIGYRYFSIAKPRIETVAGQKFDLKKAPHANNVIIGLRFKF